MNKKFVYQVGNNKKVIYLPLPLISVVSVKIVASLTPHVF